MKRQGVSKTEVTSRTEGVEVESRGGGNNDHSWSKARGKAHKRGA